MVEVKRKSGESTAAMIRRFTRRVQKSGILLRARKERFYQPKPKKRRLREKALRRAEVAREHERLSKLGKLPEDQKKKTW
ncbi:MAG: 30S ribosomal protein S21 [Candidatus Colwellbacteria bacterium]|nr:30S ribosomal protein S21 [Candidatus Colwellbacteria bacterium]